MATPGLWRSGLAEAGHASPVRVPRAGLRIMKMHNAGKFDEGGDWRERYDLEE